MGPVPSLVLDAETLSARAALHGRAPAHWTRPQQQLFDSPYKLTVWWGANGIGKSWALAEVTRRALGGLLPWQTSRKRTVMLVGNTYKQLGVTLEYLFSSVPSSWFGPRIRFSAGMVKGQRMPVYDVVGGPGAGSTLVLGVFDAENLAGPRAEVVISDEPLPESVHNELWPRLLGRGGRMYVGFTPTLGTASDVQYLWKLVDDPSLPHVGEIHTPLTLDAVTPRGGLVELPWLSARDIAEHEAGLSALEADMRMGRSRTPRRETAYFSAWGPHLIRDEAPPIGAVVGVGIDHGPKPGTQRAVLVAAARRGLHAHLWVLDEYASTDRTTPRGAAAGVVAMLARSGLEPGDVDLWIGDRAHHGDHRGGAMSNRAFLEAMASELGIPTERRGWTEQLPASLRHMKTPRKYEGSVWEGSLMLHRLMVDDPARITVSSRCTLLHADFAGWQGSTSPSDPYKHGLDGLRYIAVPLLEGRSR